jgi:hypothetical protein
MVEIEEKSTHLEVVLGLHLESRRQSKICVIIDMNLVILTILLIVRPSFI